MIFPVIFPGEFSHFGKLQRFHRTDIEKLQVIQQHVGEACHRVATSAEAQRWHGAAQRFPEILGKFPGK